jgi:hypothetical protein
VRPLGTRAFALLVASCCLVAVFAAPVAALARRDAHPIMVQAPPPRDFGFPPSGAIPILYNNHHVYSKPDTLRRGRVLAALAYDDTILVPLRSMFEQMGATVSYDSFSRTVTVSKHGNVVRLTVGERAVDIDGEMRPLDVPPMIYDGVVLVPVRVISESMGAYVQWLPGIDTVVVSYEPARPRHWMAPPPPPPPTPTPTHYYKDAYVAGDFIISPRVYNEFSPGNAVTSSYAFRGAMEFDAWRIPWMLAVDYRQYQYPHFCSGPGDAQCYVTTIGNTGSTYTPAHEEEDSDVDVRLGVRVLSPRIYIGVGYLERSNNYGYPGESGFGFGAEKLPDLDQLFSVFGSVWYYPEVQGRYVDPFGVPYNLDYHDLKYEIGVLWNINRGGLFIEAGWLGDSGTVANPNDPDGYGHNGPFAGIGVKL